MWRRPTGRVWRYRYGQWTPSWWAWILPQRFHGGDEYGRHTVVVHVPLVGFVVWAYRLCRCDDCVRFRAEEHEMSCDACRDEERPCL